MDTELIWQHLDTPGWEHVRITRDHPGWDVYDSIFVRTHGDQVLRGGYTLVTDKHWRTLELRLMVETSPGAMEGLHLMTEGDGRWTDADERHIPELDGILDLEIQWTPLTASLPINRISLETGVEQQIPVAYISLPDMVISSTVQAFTRIDKAHVLHRSPVQQGAAELTMDANGYVTEYPNRFIKS